MFNRGESGQATVEFAAAGPLLVLLVIGLISAAWLVLQHEAVVNAARSGARQALVETSLASAAGCESGLPRPIQQAAQTGAAVIPVNPATLCQSPRNPAELVQPAAAGKANLTVTGSPSLNPSEMSSLTVTIDYRVTPFPPLPQLVVDLHASSTLPAR